MYNRPANTTLTALSQILYTAIYWGRKFCGLSGNDYLQEYLCNKMLKYPHCQLTVHYRIIYRKTFSSEWNICENNESYLPKDLPYTVCQSPANSLFHPSFLHNYETVTHTVFHQITAGLVYTQVLLSGRGIVRYNIIKHIV